jgi:hypothetical protein
MTTAWEPGWYLGQLKMRHHALDPTCIVKSRAAFNLWSASSTRYVVHRACPSSSYLPCQPRARARSVRHRQCAVWVVGEHGREQTAWLCWATIRCLPCTWPQTRPRTEQPSIDEEKFRTLLDCASQHSCRIRRHLLCGAHRLLQHPLALTVLA